MNARNLPVSHRMLLLQCALPVLVLTGCDRRPDVGSSSDAAVTAPTQNPANPPGAKIDPETAVVRYTSGAVQKDFPQAANLSACQSGQFYIEGDRIKLCPDTCNLVQGDPNAKVKVLFSCFPKDVQ